jgi:hypothetical protein
MSQYEDTLERAARPVVAVDPSESMNTSSMIAGSSQSDGFDPQCHHSVGPPATCTRQIGRGARVSGKGAIS